MMDGKDILRESLKSLEDAEKDITTAETLLKVQRDAGLDVTVKAFELSQVKAQHKRFKDAVMRGLADLKPVEPIKKP